MTTTTIGDIEVHYTLKGQAEIRIKGTPSEVCQILMKLNNDLKLLYSNRVVEIGRFSVNSIHATHYLKFSVKITTNQLHYYFRKKAPFIKKEVSPLFIVTIL